MATFANLGVSIATKVDTSNIKKSVGGLRSDIRAVDNSILALASDLDDFRQESRWNVALSGGTPIAINNGGTPQYVQLQVQPQNMQQTPFTPTQQMQPQAPVQTVTINPSSGAAEASIITKQEFNEGLTNMMSCLGNLMNGFIENIKTLSQNNAGGSAPEAAPASTEKKDG